MGVTSFRRRALKSTCEQGRRYSEEFVNTRMPEKEPHMFRFIPRKSGVGDDAEAKDERFIVRMAEGIGRE
jgi:hypothetical protein